MILNLRGLLGTYTFKSSLGREIIALGINAPYNTLHYQTIHTAEFPAVLNTYTCLTSTVYSTLLIYITHTAVLKYVLLILLFLTITTKVKKYRIYNS